MNGCAGSRWWRATAGTARTYDLAERKQAPSHPIGVILLARLAVDGSVQGQGYGRVLVADAAIRSLQAADLVSARALLVHARNQRAASFAARALR